MSRPGAVTGSLRSESLMRTPEATSNNTEMGTGRQVFYLNGERREEVKGHGNGGRCGQLVPGHGVPKLAVSQELERDEDENENEDRRLGLASRHSGDLAMGNRGARREGIKRSGEASFSESLDAGADEVCCNFCGLVSCFVLFRFDFIVCVKYSRQAIVHGGKADCSLYFVHFLIVFKRDE